jgi:hypothetical protein
VSLLFDCLNFTALLFISLAPCVLGLTQSRIFVCFASISVDLTEEGGIRASRSALDFAFPPELAEAVRRLYHLRRGSLISPGPMRSSDDRAEIRSLFLRFPLEDCISMIAPALWSSGVICATSPSTPSMELVPAETLALWDNVSESDIFKIKEVT